MKPSAAAWPVLLVVAGQVLLAAAWVAVDRTPPYWDEAWYMYQGAAQLDALRAGGAPAWYDAWINLDQVRPSLVPTLAMPFYAAFGVSAQSGLLVNLVAWALLLTATYGLGSSVAGRRAGLLAAIFVGSSPALIGLVHILLVETVMTALVAVTLLALWRSNGFRWVGWSCLAGLVTGLGMLTKVFYAIFVAGPWIVTLWLAWRGTGDPAPELRPPRWRNLLLAAGLALALAAAWYAPNVRPLITRSIDAAVGAEAAPYGPADPWQLRSLLGYGLRFIGMVTGAAGALLVLLGLVGLQRERRNYSNADWAALAFLASSALTGYLVFTSLHNQDMKHVVGVLPALAALTGWGLACLWPGGQRWVAAFAFVLMAAQVLFGTFPGRWTGGRVAVPIWGQPLLLFYAAQPSALDTRYAAPDPSPWPLGEALDYAVAVSGPEARVGVVPNYPGVEEHALRFEARRRNMAVSLSTAPPADLENLDVLIHKTGDLGDAIPRPGLNEVVERVAEGRTKFRLLPRTFPLPDGSEVLLFAPSSPLLQDPPRPEHPTTVDFGDTARFLGFDSALDGQTFTLTYYWETLAAADVDYSVFVHLLDGNGVVIAQDDHMLFERVYPSSVWEPGRFLAETRTIALPSTDPGTLPALRLGLYHEDVRLPITAAPTPGKIGSDHYDAGPAG